MGLTVGIDIGGTKIAGGVVDEQGRILATARRESPATDSGAIERGVADLVAELRGSHQIEGVGVGAAGFIDAARSTVLFAPNLAWRDEPLKTDLEKGIGLP
ncbi:MAG: ROK family protein, partial [Nocardioides sp.]